MWQIEGSDARFRDIQMGNPSLLDARTPATFVLLRQWLDDCDKNHVNCGVAGSISPPTRLLEIGTRANPALKLVTSSDLSNSGKELKYVAFSYPWGDKKGRGYYQTTKHNFSQHQKAISYGDLPEAFQDAIQVAREINIPYLWIDSLCIMQGKGGDFDFEAPRMEAVFSGAYCVVAASRATGMWDNFLHTRTAREYVALQSGSGAPLYASEDIDDFQRDVIDGHLNKRGWVLQERALARRTIYFTENQIYWECGHGIRCETFTKMTNKQASFLGDPNFPKVARRDSKGTRILFWQTLYQQYSRLGFSHDWDRPMGIAGLEQRLLRAFNSKGGFGVFELYIGRSMLWRRAPGVESLTRISLPPGRAQVPSWSWMAYKGAISFLEPPFGNVEWNKDEFSSPWKQSPDNPGVRFKFVARDLIGGVTVENLFMDGDLADSRPLKCAVIGKLEAENGVKTQRHYVLLLSETSEPRVYERKGVGIVTGDQIMPNGLDVLVA